MDTQVNIAAFEQAMELFRHYGNLRFTVVAAFVGLSTAIFALAYKSAEGFGPRRVYPLPCLAGMLISVVFFLAEMRIEHKLQLAWDTAKAVGEKLGMAQIAITDPPQTALWSWIAMLAMWSIYISSFGLWIATWCLLRGMRDRSMK